MRKSLLLWCAALLAALVCFQSVTAQDVTQGTLAAVGKAGALGECPLKRTEVKAEISGFLSRVRIRQEFENNFAERIEAVYVFPLPNNAAVDEMTMQIGDRTIRGRILKREEARQVYETAKESGQTAALLDQERPNIFTQSVANILPGEKITVEISYVETLKYEEGSYEFVFPTVVAPRYNPAQVKDAKNIEPPKAVRAGHDISIEVNLDAGVPVENVVSKSHEIETVNLAPNKASVKLRNQNEIPNRDFVLRFDVSGKRIEDAVLSHRTERGGFFTLILQPPDRMTAADITPKEIVFVLDTSGSMDGFPIEKAKESMRLALDNLHPLDTFNLITFAGETRILFDAPVPATRENLRRAQEVLDSSRGYGGTEMMTAIKAALEPTDSQQHVRVVCFMTDGQVGNEAEIIAEVQKHPNARIFAFGIGDSVNRHLLDKISSEGRGEVEYVGLKDDGSAAARRFHERVRAPLLTDLEIDWNGLPVADVYPRKIQDLFSAKPVVLHGRYTKAAGGTIKLKGKVSGQEIVREIAVNLPETENKNDSLATLWARTRIEDLTAQDLNNTKPEIQQTITNLGLEYRLLTQFTSFVAVEDRIITENGKPRRVEVPVAMPNETTVDVAAGDEVGIVISSQTSSLPKGVSFSSVLKASPAKRPQTANAGFNTPGASGSVATTKSKVRRKQRSGKGSGRGSGQGDGNGTGKGNGDAVVIVNEVLTRQQATSEGETIAQTAAVVSGDVVNGKALNLVQPIVPMNGHWRGNNGTVSVQVLIDENGNVVLALAVSGHPLLRASAVHAARQSKFTPTNLSGKAVKTTGVIVYNFVPDSAAKIAVEQTQPAPNLTDEQIRQRKLDAKLHFRLGELLDALRKGDAKLEKFAFVQAGKAEIFLELETDTPEIRAELEKLGLEILPNQKPGIPLTARIAPDKLAELALLDGVKLVSPRTN